MAAARCDEVNGPQGRQSGLKTGGVVGSKNSIDVGT